ncbi:unnamed protein product [Auanema sp. JU1783]|nr:unnamed protein product [Auanema sp. JU1783]
MSTESLCISRCICIHSSLQLVDLTIASICLHHSILPTPISTIPNPPPHGMIRTISSFQSVQEELQKVFRSRFRYQIKEVMLVVGQSPFRPLQVYSLPISLCEGHGSSHVDCGSPCMEMTTNEIRKVNLQLFRSFPPENKGKNSLRMFVYIRGTDALVGENLEESEISLDENKLVSIHYGHKGCSCSKTCEIEDDGSIRWLRLSPFVVQGKLV